jgi:hypothetical protein
VLGFGACGIKFDEHGPLFTGLLVPSHRGCRDLSFLSSNRTQTQLRSKDIEKGDDPRVGYDTGTNYPVGLAGLRLNP